MIQNPGAVAFSAFLTVAGIICAVIGGVIVADDTENRGYTEHRCGIPVHTKIDVGLACSSGYVESFVLDEHGNATDSMVKVEFPAGDRNILCKKRRSVESFISGIGDNGFTCYTDTLEPESEVRGIAAQIERVYWWYLLFIGGIISAVWGAVGLAFMCSDKLYECRICWGCSCLDGCDD